MKINHFIATALIGFIASVSAPSSQALLLIGGIDFDVASPSNHTPPSTTWTESGHLSVPATAAKDYNVTHNGITFDIRTINANLANQNRYRGANNAANPLNNLTPLTVDFIQWFGRDQPGPVESTITLTGLTPNLNHVLTFYHYNAGAFQDNHSLYLGSSVATGTLLGTFQASGNPNNPATWVPSVDYNVMSDSNGEIVVTMLASTYMNGNFVESRLTFNGMSVSIPEPSHALLLGLGGGLLLLRRRR